MFSQLDHDPMAGNSFHLHRPKQWQIYYTWSCDEL